MGSLKQVVAQRATIETAGGDFTVGPLTAADVLGLFVVHREGVQSMFDAYQKSGDADGIFTTILVTFPEIAAEIIARAAGEFDEGGITAARSLDFGAQLMALEQIGTLTVSSVGGLGNLASLVERLAGQVNENAKATANGVVESLSKGGFTTSENSAPSSSEQDTQTPTTTPSG